MGRSIARSVALFAEAKQYMPGGVNSPVRSFRSVGGNPLFIARAQGSRLYDEDGNSYIDYVGSWGPMILGHAHPAVTEALHAALDKGTSYGAPTAVETELAKVITRALPAVEMVRMVNSGTEATMSALRLARGYTGRNKIVKFAGCYHGHGDSLLVKAGSGVATLGLPDSPGVPPAVAANTLTAPFNDIGALTDIFRQHGDDIAAVIIEPVPGNMGTVLPLPGYLQAVRDLTRDYGALLIFDEVMTGFRVVYGGAQRLFGIEPDLTTLGKIIGGGLPVGAYGGKREIMEHVAPVGPVYQAGTLSGNPLAMTAGLVTLRYLEGHPEIYDTLAAKTAKLCAGIRQVAEELGFNLCYKQIGSMFTVFFTATDVVDYETAKTAAVDQYAVYFQTMLNQGIYLAPSQFEAAFVSIAHSDADIAETVAASRIAMMKVRERVGA